jgi:hypothetical protein
MTFTQNLALRFGRRGVILQIIGIIWIVLGQGLLADPPPPERFSKPGPSPLDWMDSHLWGWPWIICGIIALGVGLGRRATPDSIGFGAAMLPVAPWTVFFWYSWLVYEATNGQFGEPNNWRGGVTYLLIIVFVRTCAGWDDPTDPYPRKGKESDSGA